MKIVHIIEVVLLIACSFILGVSYGYKRATRLVLNPELEAMKDRVAEMTWQASDAKRVASEAESTCASLAASQQSRP